MANDDQTKGSKQRLEPLAATERYPVRRRIRLPRIQYSQGHAFFITIDTHKRHPWFSLHPALCKQAEALLARLSQERGTVLYAWCIMPDHVHLLLEDGELVEYVRAFKGSLTPPARKIDPRRKLWQRSFYDHALRQEESVYRIARYIWENPVRAGLEEEPEEFSWIGSEVCRISENSIIWPDAPFFAVLGPRALLLARVLNNAVGDTFCEAFVTWIFACSQPTPSGRG